MLEPVSRWEAVPAPPPPTCPPASPQSHAQMEGVQAALTLDDVVECEAALKRNARFQALMAQRYGIADMAQLAVDPWCGLLRLPAWRRCCRRRGMGRAAWRLCCHCRFPPLLLSPPAACRPPAAAALLGSRSACARRCGSVPWPCHQADPPLLCCCPCPCLCPCRYSGIRYGSPDGRILQCLLYKRSSADDNHYAHPRALRRLAWAFATHACCLQRSHAPGGSGAGGRQGNGASAALPGW